jgi:hypothetical protein
MRRSSRPAARRASASLAPRSCVAANAPAVEHRRVGDGAGSHDAGHVAVDQAASAFRRADLLADRDLVAGIDEAGDVCLRGVVGNPRHGYPRALSHFAAGKDDIEDRGRGFSIGIEGFVEVAEAKEENGVGKTAFDLKVLAAHGGQGGQAVRGV